MGSEGGRAVYISLPLTSTLTVASHAWFGFCLIGIAVHRARLASARWHAPQLRFASSLLPICTSSLGGSEGGRAVHVWLPAPCHWSAVPRAEYGLLYTPYMLGSGKCAKRAALRSLENLTPLEPTTLPLWRH